jgi:transcriptional regulator with XRE-family HTH domain
MVGMSDEVKRNLPYQPLGLRLKKLRQKLQETLAEVSGAVEIDVDAMQQFEQGTDRPSEDILELLISHFGLKDSEAKTLWKLAGYTEAELRSMNRDDDNSSAVVLPIDARVMYTDMVNVMVNEYGVIMNFMQGAGVNNQPMVVTRLGMSKEHARSIIELLQKTLAQVEPKLLPPSTEKTDK